jgi:hypothetical protein
MQKLLKFIIDQELEDFNELPKLLEPLKENFNIRDHEGNEAAKELLDTIIYWEKHPAIYESLESILNKKYFVKELQLMKTN